MAVITQEYANQPPYRSSTADRGRDYRPIQEKEASKETKHPRTRERGSYRVSFFFNIKRDEFLLGSAGASLNFSPLAIYPRTFASLPPPEAAAWRGAQKRFVKYELRERFRFTIALARVHE